MKLTLRELFLLVALVAMGCGWWVQWKSAERSADEAKAFAEAIVAWEYSVALKDAEIRKLEQRNDLLAAKLRETGFRWHFRQGYKVNGDAFIFMVDD